MLLFRILIPISFPEYWAGCKQSYGFPKNIKFVSKLDTDLFEFAKNKTYPVSLAFSADGKKFATLSTDRRVRVFNFLTGKLVSFYLVKHSLSIFTYIYCG